MDGGRIARLGFRFQDTAAVWLALRNYIEIFFSSAHEVDLGRLGIGIEVIGTTDSPSWDIFLGFDQAVRILYEVKSGTISKDDKSVVFWNRVRKEASVNHFRLKVGWIVETNSGSGFADKLQKLKDNAFSIVSADVPDSEPVEDIRNWENLRNAALYRMCRYDREDATLLTLDTAKSLLSQMEIIKVSENELYRETDRLLDAVFPHAFPVHIFAQLRESLERIAVGKNTAIINVKQLFSATSFIFGDSNAMEAYRFIKNNWGENSEIRNDAISPWTGNVKFKDIDHPVLRRIRSKLDTIQEKCFCLIGHAGVGKSVLTETLYKKKYSTLSGSSDYGIPRTLYIVCAQIASGSISVENVRTALKIIISLGPVLVAVDGLDDLHGSKLAEFAAALSVAANQDSAEIIISCRDEVFNMQPETEPLRKEKRFRTIRLEAWDVDTVKKVIAETLNIDYTEKISLDLLAVLTTPFFLDIFLQICLEDSELNPDSNVFGTRNSADLLEKYVDLRIKASSVSEGNNENLQRVEACNELLHRTFMNIAVFDKNVHPSGINSLLNNGVLISSSINNVTFRHRLLQDYLSADFIAAKIDASADNEFSEEHTLISGIRNASFRNGIMHMLAAIVFNSVNEDVFKKRLEWIKWIENKANDANGDSVFSFFLTAWSRMSPVDYQKCDPQKWPDTSIPIFVNTISMLVGEIKALPSVNYWKLAFEWWDAAISKWTEKCFVNRSEVLLSIFPLVEVLFQNRQWQREEKAYEAAEILIRWTRGKGRLLRQSASDHTLFIEMVCAFAAEIPFDWLIDHAQTFNSWSCGNAVKYINKLTPQSRTGEAIIHLCGIEREEGAGDVSRRWKFMPGRGNSDMFDYRLLHENLEERKLITTNPEVVFSAFAGYIDALKNREDSQFSFSRVSDSGLCEDHSTTWYWRNSDNEHNTAVFIAKSIREVLKNAAMLESPVLFRSLKNKLYSNSDMILFRTLIADALLKAEYSKRDWHKYEWVELLSDHRLLDSYSMNYWVRAGIKRWIGAFTIENRETIYKGIRQLVEIGNCYVAYECILCAKEFISREASDLLSVPVPEGYSDEELIHPEDEPTMDGVAGMADDLEGLEKRIFFRDSAPEDIEDYHKLSKWLPEILTLFSNFSGKSAEIIEKEIIPQIITILDNAIVPMTRVLNEPERRVNDPYPLEYAYYLADTIKKISFKSTNSGENSMTDEEIHKFKNKYADNISHYAPWLNEAMRLALMTLERHKFSEEEPDESAADLLSFPSSSWMYTIALWNLLVWPTCPLAPAEWNDQMLTALTSRRIPDRYRVVFVTHFYYYNIFREGNLQKMVWQWFEEADRAELLVAYSDTLLRNFQKERVEIIRIILEKDFLKGNRHDLDRWLCSRLCYCWYRRDLQEKSPRYKEITALAELAEKILSGELPVPIPDSMAIGFAFSLVESYHAYVQQEVFFVDVGRLAEGLTRVIDIYLLSQKDTKNNRDSLHIAFAIGQCFDIPQGISEKCVEKLTDCLWLMLKPVVLKMIENSNVQGIHEILYSIRKESGVRDKIRLSGIPPEWSNALDIVEAVIKRTDILIEFAPGDQLSIGYDIVEFILTLMGDNRLGRPAAGSHQENRLITTIIPRLENMGATKIQALKQRVFG